VAISQDRGSITPLILGFFLVGLLMVAAAVVASDVFAKQLDLQSVCDGAAIAGSNAASGPAVRTQGLGMTLPLDAAQRAVDAYLDRDVGRQSVHVVASLSADGSTVVAACVTKSKVALGLLIGRPSGVEQRATSSAKGIIR
jgi:hypothetical protein